MGSVWICNPFDNLAEEGARPQRYSLLSSALAERGHDVVWWTSSFSHVRHAPRVSPSGEPLPSAWRRPDGVEMRLAATPQYRSNVSFARIRNHRAYADGLAAWAMDEVSSGRLARPDVVIVSSPPLSTSRTAMLFKREWGCRVVVDVMDAWPDAFAGLLPAPGILGRLAMGTILAPLVRASGVAFRMADAVTATSRSYLDLAKSRGATAPMKAFHHVCTEVRDATHDAAEGDETDSAPLRIAYIGGMGRLYDLETLVRAMGIAATRGVRATLEIAGTGGKEVHLRRLATDMPSVTFHGFLDPSMLDGLLARAEVGIVPLLPGSSVAIPYKLPDYASRSLAILECLGGECGELVAEYGAGLHYEARDPVLLADAIERLAGDRRSLSAMRKASGRMACDEFLASTVLAAMCDFVTNLA